MSGFDFDALRDPVAPEPGSRERALVEARARQLRARNRRTRIVLSATSLVAVVAIVAGVVAVTHQPGPTVTVENPSTTLPPTTSPTTAGKSIDGRFIPPTSLDKNGFVKMPVTFPDGETTTLRYPAGMQIAQLGFTTGAGVSYPVTGGSLPCCSKVLNISYATVHQVYGDAKPIKVYRGANGDAVDYFHASQAVNATKQDYLTFQFGPWLVQVYDVQHSGDFERRMTDAQRATWARSLTGTLDPNGYLVLHAQAPLSIDNALESGFGFGADTAAGNTVELDPHLYCNEPGMDTSGHRQVSNDRGHGVSWCVGKDLRVAAIGSARFADLATDLQVSPLQSPGTSTPTATTTTTSPRLPPAPAVSASFVSTQHGWVLETNGAVLGTTDGGTSWHAVGSLRRPSLGLTIRFADASTGFAFASDGSVPVQVTHDGGVSWSPLQAPFSHVSDLAISHGAVYVAAFETSGTTFRIWSSPVRTLSWTEAPILVPVGAGPVPQIQFVFAGDRGWLVEVDRVVTAGAQMSATGEWSTWSPPCSGAGGPVYLAASTAQDLVAACLEGVWTGPRITNAIYFSHDGGSTFTRRKFTGPDVGVSGPFSPSPDVAVVADGGALERTSDGGGSWHLVSHIPPSGAPDGGFTSATQGFVILGDGQMLMTYDAGVSWTQVTLP